MVSVNEEGQYTVEFADGNVLSILLVDDNGYPLPRDVHERVLTEFRDQYDSTVDVEDGWDEEEYEDWCDND
jgi:hypothetical protein